MEELIGKSKPIQQIRRKIQQLAKTDKDVLVIGERGVGKSVVAKNIHFFSPNATKPVIHLDLTTIEELKLRSIVDSILTKREFVNAEISGRRRIDLPEGTSLIIDRVEQTSVPAQKIVVNLLRELGQKTRGMRVMLLLSLESLESPRASKLIGGFKEDLKGWQKIIVPPLRNRREDIPDLIDYFVRRAAEDLGIGEVAIDINAVSLLARKEWKGNVQQLKNFVDQALMLSEDKETFTLPESLIDEQSELAEMLQRIDDGIEFAIDRSMELIERRILERVLNKFGFNQSRAARFLKITEDTLRYRMKKLGIHS